MAREMGSGSGRRLDMTALLGLCVSIGGILAGLLLEGGRIADVAQITAAIIVFGGTIGAVMLTTPLSVARSAMRRVKASLFEQSGSPFEMIEEIIILATKARKGGVVALEPDVARIEDPFLHKALMLSVDGTDLKAIREMMELEMKMDAAEAEMDARVFESAGGYAPTIGIIGAVIGLIQVMKHLDNLSQVGYGIAVAFVATIYGVGSANLIFLPLGQKIRIRSHQTMRSKQLMLEGVVSINEGMNPRLIRRKLEAFVRDRRRSRRIQEVDPPSQRLASA
jgi:chemotaxis protein MotA